MKILFLLTFFALDTLPAFEQLDSSLATYYAEKEAAELAEFAESTAGNWMRYTPSVGIAYTPAGEPRPGVSYNLATLFRSIQGNRDKEAKQESIKRKNRLAYQTDRRKLLSELRKLRAMEEDYELELEIHEIDQALFEVQKKKAENAEITPTEFLKDKRAFLLKKKAMREKKRKLNEKMLEITNISKYYIP